MRRPAREALFFLSFRLPYARVQLGTLAPKGFPYAEHRLGTSLTCPRRFHVAILALRAHFIGHAFYCQKGYAAARQRLVRVIGLSKQQTASLGSNVPPKPNLRGGERRQRKMAALLASAARGQLLVRPYRCPQGPSNCWTFPNRSPTASSKWPSLRCGNSTPPFPRARTEIRRGRRPSTR